MSCPAKLILLAEPANGEKNELVYFGDSAV